MSLSRHKIMLFSALFSAPCCVFGQQPAAPAPVPGNGAPLGVAIDSKVEQPKPIENTAPQQLPPATPGNSLENATPVPSAPATPSDMTTLPPGHPMAPKSATPATPAQPGAQPVADPNAPAFPELANEMNKTDENLVNIRNVPINDVLQFLARRAGMQYFHNNRINGPDYTVTGHLNKANPLEQMRSLASFYNLELFEKDGTIYALDKGQVAQMPSTEWHYQLRYLRPKDIDHIKKLLQPMLSKETGVVNFEPKTNTVIVVDTARRIQDVQKLLSSIDREKGQISLETKILRTNREKGSAVGVDWSSTLGRNGGVSLAVTDNLNALFNLNPRVASGDPIAPGSESGVGGVLGDSVGNGGVVLSPIQMKAVLRALNDKNLVSQESSPTLITEDNEQAIIAIIDRVPIITATVNNTSGATTTTEQVRYKIGEDDPTLSDANAAGQTREIGVTVTVTPNILPDGSVRMYLRPRAAQITGYETAAAADAAVANKYPRVRESSVETIARVPGNSTLLLGGFYENITTTTENKVPILGDIPVINFFFKSKTNLEEQTSLVFAITPKVYNPSSSAQTKRISRETEDFLRQAQVNAQENQQENVAPKAQPKAKKATQKAPAKRYQRMGPVM